MDNKPDIEGMDKFVYQLYLNTSFDKKAQGEFIDSSTYDYFSDIEEYGCNIFSELVEELAFRTIYEDPMGTTVYFKDICGMTLKDLYDIDFITFRAYDKRAIDISDEYITSRQAAKTAVENQIEKGQNG